MKTLVLKLAGPLQAWGVESRFTERKTLKFPSKSGIIGLLAAADGRRRSDPVEDLARLSLAIRVDAPGRIVQDFHTAHRASGKAMPLTQRYYLSDAVFIAAIGGDDPLISHLAHRAAQPAYPPFLGRRSCPPSYPWVLGIRDADPIRVIEDEPWQASEEFQTSRRRIGSYRARIVADELAVSQPGDMVQKEKLRDYPISFDPRGRKYAWRDVLSWDMEMVEKTEEPNGHDPMSLLMPGAV